MHRATDVLPHTAHPVPAAPYWWLHAPCCGTAAALSSRLCALPALWGPQAPWANLCYRPTLPRCFAPMRWTWQVFSIEITRNYRLAEWRDDLKGLYRQAGVLGKPSVFLFDETQIKLEAFLEDVNNILTSGEVPNLFAKASRAQPVGARDDGALWEAEKLFQDANTVLTSGEMPRCFSEAEGEAVGSAPLRMRGAHKCPMGTSRWPVECWDWPMGNMHTER
jgi:hypothetical protein